MRFVLASLLLVFAQCAWAQEVVDLVRVLKSERKLQLISKGKVVHQFSIALGADPVGHKQQEGDERTPEGRYVLDFKKADSAYYKAIHISYPNAADTEAARRAGVSPGGQIMIHGQKNGLGWLSGINQHFNWTNGCVALSNANMDVVWNSVKVGTPIELLP